MTLQVEESGIGKNKNEWEAQSHNGWYQWWKTSLSQSLKHALCSTTCHRIPPISSTVITFVCLWILDPRNLKWHENKSCWLKHCFYTDGCTEVSISDIQIVIIRNDNFIQNNLPKFESWEEVSTSLFLYILYMFKQIVHFI